MSSTKDEQRAAARARLDQEMAGRAAAARRRRHKQAVLGSAIALVVVVAGTAFRLDAFGTEGAARSNSASGPTTAGATANCDWKSEPSGGQNKGAKEVGSPAVSVPARGNRTLTIDTNLGPITTTMDLSKVPCTAASFSYLAGKKFWDNTKCHRLLTEALHVLQCGDPNAKGTGFRDADGTGGPTYVYAEENLPVGKGNPYPAGTLAMVKNKAPGTTGSQFFLVYDDTTLDPVYTVVGPITKGLDIVKNVAAAGHDNTLVDQGGGGHPKLEVVVKTVVVADS